VAGRDFFAPLDVNLLNDVRVVRQRAARAFLTPNGLGRVVSQEGPELLIRYRSRRLSRRVIRVPSRRGEQLKWRFLRREQPAEFQGARKNRAHCTRRQRRTTRVVGQGAGREIVSRRRGQSLAGLNARRGRQFRQRNRHAKGVGGQLPALQALAVEGAAI